MADGDTQFGSELGDAEDVAEPEFDRLAGVVTDGLIGAVGGLVGTAALTMGLFVGASIGVFEFDQFSTIGDLTGLDALFPANPIAVGFVMFLLGGMFIWPLLLASIGSYLPGDRFALKGLSFGFVLWTGFVLAFYSGQTGLALALYVVVTLLAHFAYGFTLGSVFDYLGTRPETLV